MTKNEESWLANYEALKQWTLEHGHFPNKHDKRLNWYHSKTMLKTAHETIFLGGIRENV